MNQEIKAKWVAALRSGEYLQAQGALRSKGGMCCLGVLCDLHAKEKGIQWHGNNYFQEDKVLPREIQNWSELNDYRGEIYAEGDFSLTTLNDGGLTFDWIAAIIETEL